MKNQAYEIIKKMTDVLHKETKKIKFKNNQQKYEFCGNVLAGMLGGFVNNAIDDSQSAEKFQYLKDINEGSYAVLTVLVRMMDKKTKDGTNEQTI
jgi:hypothetical protein